MWILLTQLFLLMLRFGSGQLNTTIASGELNATNTTSKSNKALSAFQVYAFPNSPCIVDTQTNQTGTCYHSYECTQKGGASQGSCANGFGVCCLFSVTCDQKTYENNTYFVGKVAKPGPCPINVCQSGSSDVCQIRIDFAYFSIIGPSTDTNEAKYLRNGNDGFKGNTVPYKPVSIATQCQMDIFTVDSQGGYSPPPICGVNTGQHIYMDTGRSDCARIMFQFGDSPIERRWNLMVKQIACGDPYLPPSGCTQYYFGSKSGMVQSFNYDNGVLLADQTQQICIRREIGTCKICWTTSTNTDFQISGFGTIDIVPPFIVPSPPPAMPTTQLFRNYDYTCYRNFGCQSDCVMIPGTNAAKNTFCGQMFALTKTNRTPVTICSVQTPFTLTFFSDSYSNILYPLPTMPTMPPGPSTAPAMKGFKLKYWLLSC